tara:strand:+ start:397 stop:738 length:342 start_codon:yes stop_codon:yes gene_type:complete
MVDEVIRPNMILKGRFMTNTGAIIKPKTATLRLLLRHFETFLTPDPLNSLVVHAPTLLIKKSGYSSITIASILRCQFNYSFSERLIELSSLFLIALNGSMLPNDFAGTSLRDV